jgi:hypothetical protein
MDFVYWIIVIVLIVGVVWWLLNRSNSAKSSGSGTSQERPGASAPAHGVKADGALAGGSAAASAEAAATAGIPSAAAFGRAAEPAPPTTADDSAEMSGTAAGQEMPPAAEPASAGAAEPASAGAAEPASAGAAEPAPADTSDSHHEAGQPMPDDMSNPDGSTRQDGGAGQEGSARPDDQAEWETQWSEASGSAETSHGARPAAEPAGGATSSPPAGTGPAHHAEYTGAHSPTLPGAETAAGEAVEEALPLGQPAEGTAVPERGAAVPENAAATETLDRTESSAAAETAAGHAQEPAADGMDYGTGAEPAGHLAADQPYGEGSASPAPDGSGPADYTVKGDAGSMVYYEEGYPDYEQTRAEVWFESAAHAEAAGFRAPRRTRL